MKLLIVLALVAVAVARPDDNHYDTKYDNFNIDELVSNTRLVQSYAQCFLGQGKCTPEGNDVKKWIPDATKTSCAKCTEKQKIMSAKFIKALQEKCPKEWEILHKEADPTGANDENLKKFLEQYAK